MVMNEMKEPRKTYILTRGDYDKPAEEVQPGTPKALPPLPDDLPPNRLALAKWLVSRDHPLTARVTVNRYWQQLFGTGIVKTSQDFGAQGEWPSHPELLDWLAVEFMESGWDTRHMLRLMVTSVETCSGPRAYAGLVSSYYERIEENFQRLTDPDWEAMLELDPPPESPEWPSPLLAE